MNFLINNDKQNLNVHFRKSFWTIFKIITRRRALPHLSKSYIWNFETIRFVPLSFVASEQYRAIKQYFYLIFVLYPPQSTSRMRDSTKTRLDEKKEKKKKKENVKRTEKKKGGKKRDKEREDKRKTRERERGGVESNATKMPRWKTSGFIYNGRRRRRRHQVAPFARAARPNAFFNFRVFTDSWPCRTFLPFHHGFRRGKNLNSRGPQLANHFYPADGHHSHRNGRFSSALKQQLLSNSCHSPDVFVSLLDFDVSTKEILRDFNVNAIYKEKKINKRKEKKRREEGLISDILSFFFFFYRRTALKLDYSELFDYNGYIVLGPEWAKF